MIQTWFRFGAGLVQIWFRFGSDLGQVWIRFSSYLAQLWIVCGSDVVWVGYSLGPGSTVDPEQGAFDEIFTVAQNTCWDPQGTQLIAMATKFGFDCTEVEDELRASWSPTARNDSRNGGGAPLLASGVRPPAARFLHRADTEEELRHIKMRTELYTSRKLLAEQEVQDANRNNHSEVREQVRVGSVRFPPAAVIPQSVLAVLQDVLPVLATRQALQAHQQLATPPGTVLEEHVAQSDVEMRIALARRAQLERLTPRSGPTDNQAMVGQSEMATRKMESSTAEQGAEHALEAHPVTRAQQSEEMSVEEAEAKAMKWLGVMQDMKTKKQQ